MAKTYEQILAEMLSTVANGIDKREGSPVYIPMSAAAIQFADTDIKLDNMYAEAFLATASGIYLDALAGDFGLIRQQAIPATVKAEIIGNYVPIGNKFASVGGDSIIYSVTENLSNNLYLMQATEVNPQANYYIGDIMMIDFVGNLKSAKIIEVTIPQRETETDEEFRKRVQNYLSSKVSDGNIAQFYQWISEIEGVGKAQVNSLAYGENTVGVVILNELNKPASAELITIAQAYLDPNSEGKGLGKAIIGQKVTVTTATEFIVNIDVSVVYKQGKTEAFTLRKDLEKFFEDIAFERTVVSYLQVGSVITNNIDIDYVTMLKLNNDTKDVPIPIGKVAVLGALNVNN